MQHFKFSFAVTAVLLGLAAWWGFHHGGAAGVLQAVWIATVLGVMEVSLSFDNAVVNASVLRHWNPFWQRLFLTVGIVVAVFGMRLLFPLLIVAFATGLGLVEVWHMATATPDVYAAHLTASHAQVAAFGGAFLLLVFLNFLFDEEKELHWLGWLEKKMGQHGTDSLAVLLALLAVFACMAVAGHEEKFGVLTAGVTGVAVYLAVHWISTLLEEEPQPDDDSDATETGVEAVGAGAAALALSAAGRGGIGAFLYLEVLDASFSFDGVIGAFAITSDVVVIMLGLAIGAMFVRSLTVFLVHKGTLDEFVYLEHGAHYAIGILALIMLASVKYDIPEWFTGLSGVAFIAISLWSSILYKRRRER
ncbi:MAG: DUF475 domain-containing protein [Pseudomonadota bacterium]